MNKQADISITDIKPGFVNSKMAELKKSVFRVARQDKAAWKMADAIESKRNYAYITKR